MLLLALQLAAHACEAPTGLPDLAGALDAAEEALSVLDIAAFQARVAEAEEALRCLDEPVGRHDAARLHRATGLRAFGARDDLAPAAFAAARSLEPAYMFPRSLVPRGSPVIEAYLSLPLDALDRSLLPVPRDGWIHLDGLPSLERPAALPTVYQRFGSDGAVRQTAYLLPGADPDAYEEAARGTEMLVGIVVDTGPTWWQRQRVPLAVATGSAAAVTVGLWGLSRHGRSRYLDTTDQPVPDAELDGLQARTNALAVGSGVALGLTGASGILLLTTLW